MSRFERIEEFLHECQELFWELRELEVAWNPLMDVSFRMIDEENYYGVNFTGDQRVCELFFTSQSNYFPGIWVGQGDLEDIDKYPIYVFDIAGEEEPEPLGNIKQYITKILDECLASNKCTKETVKAILDLKKELDWLSDEVIEKGEYHWVLHE